MKLYILNCGQLIPSDLSILGSRNTPRLKLIIPVPAFLIEHPTQGLILIDTGFDYEASPDPMRLAMVYSPMLSIGNQLRRLGYTEDSVKHVVLSHLHFDHTGNMSSFPKAAFYIRKSELGAAFPPSRFDYRLADYEYAVNTFTFHFIPEDEDFDLFGDGTIICLDTKGHTPGHQSFIVTLPNSGAFLLAVDAAHLSDYLDCHEYFGDAWNPELGVKAAQKLKKLAGQGMKLIFGHDPAGWSELKKAPDFYD